MPLKFIIKRLRQPTASNKAKYKLHSVTTSSSLTAWEKKSFFLFPLYSTLHACVCLFFYVIFSKHQRQDERCFVCTDHRWNGHVAERDTDTDAVREWKSSTRQGRTKGKERRDDDDVFLLLFCRLRWHGEEENTSGEFHSRQVRLFRRSKTDGSFMCMALIDTPSLDLAWM